MRQYTRSLLLRIGFVWSFFLASAIAQVPGPISADQLKGDLSFLASDALAGRFTPSPGLDIAAEFIASRFRAIGLRPLPDGTYFQNASMIERRMPAPVSPIFVTQNGAQQAIAANDYVILNSARQMKLTGVPAVFLRSVDKDLLQEMDLKGKAVILSHPDRRTSRILQQSGAAVEVQVTETLRQPSGKLLTSAAEADTYPVPVLLVKDGFLSQKLAESSPPSGITLSLNLPGPEDHPVTVRNVIGILPGSSPTLSKQAILVTAHYDHLGTAETAGFAAASGPTPQDRIYNGADDDGSGTVSVVAIAKALAHSHPQRTLIFMTFFGEELGLLGSTYYAHHPVFPLSQTVADMNLEQLGRTDEVTATGIVERKNTLLPTGFTFTNLPRFLETAGASNAVRIVNDAENSAQYFSQSDNLSLSQFGVPSTTVCTAFEFPDYHAVGDEWQKIDYRNMAAVDRTIALAVLNMADSPQPPRWNAANPETNPYRKARRQAPTEKP